MKRRRHVPTVSRDTFKASAIAILLAPSTDIMTICARRTRACGSERERVLAEMRLAGVLRNAAVRLLPPLGWAVPMAAHLTFRCSDDSRTAVLALEQVGL